VSYATIDISAQSAQPVWLYEFVQGSTAWRYTSAPVAQTHATHTWTPLPVAHTEITQSSEMSRQGITLTFPRTDTFAIQFVRDTVDAVTTVTLYRGHPSDGEFVTFWKGRVSAGKAGGQRIEVECESIFTSLRRAGLRARYQRNCRHALYQRGCNLNRASFAVAGTVSAISGNTVTVSAASAQPNGYYLGGMIMHNGVLRMIVNHVGSVLTLFRPLPGLAVSNAVTIYPGCDRSLATCISKFDNRANFGGFPWLPQKNPMGGSSII